MCAQSKELPNGALCILKELAASDKCRLGALNNEARETHEYRVRTISVCGSYFNVHIHFVLHGPAQAEAGDLLRALGILGDRPSARSLSTIGLRMSAAAAALE